MLANLSSPRKDHDSDTLDAGTNFSDAERKATSKYTEIGSKFPTRKRAKPWTDTSADAILHTELTPTSSRTSGFEKASKSVMLLSRRKSPRGSRQVVTEVEDDANLKPLNASASRTRVVPFIRGKHLTTKRKAKLEQPQTLVRDKKRNMSLEKNRFAAARCRIKRQRIERELQTRSRELVSSNRALRKIISNMSKEVKLLQSIMSVHMLSESYEMPMSTPEALSEQAVNDPFFQMDLYDNNGFEEMASLYQESFGLESFQALPPCDNFPSAWECLLPQLDLIGHPNIS